MDRSRRSIRRHAALGAIYLLAVLAACGQVQKFDDDDSQFDGDSTDDDDGASIGAGQDPANCTCKVEGDVCDVYAEDCVKPGLSCNPLNPCPTGYRCRGDECVCDDPLVCGIACSESADCPKALDCDVGSGVCRPALSCLSDLTCPAGQVCLPVAVKHASICLAPGSKAPGDSCELSYECASGICETATVCLQACKSTGDCPDGLTCAIATSFVEEDAFTYVYQFGCRADSECGNCPPDMRCAEGGGCELACDTTADCAGGTCVLGDGNRCVPDDEGCGPNEALVYGTYGASNHCLIHASCWTDDACPADYDCIDIREVDDELGISMGGTAQMCGRPLPPAQDR